MMMLINLATVYSSVQRLESAKHCFLRILAFPNQSAKDRITALNGMARCHQERKDWVALTGCCEEALALIPEAEGGLVRAARRQERLLLCLADAAEAQGDMELARDYDEKAKKLWSEFRGEGEFAELVACDRREAIELLATGQKQFRP
jgi:tetratricopeptide (TPR) repeat protein